MTLTNRRTFIHGLVGFSSLAVGGCFSSRISDDIEQALPEEYDPKIPEGVSVIHVWSEHRDAIDVDAAELLHYPITVLHLGKPNRAECIMIDGANIKPYPFASTVCVEYGDLKLKLFWHDGYSRPVLPIGSDMLRTGVYLQGAKEGLLWLPQQIKAPQDENLVALIELLRRAKRAPGQYTYP